MAEADPRSRDDDPVTPGTAQPSSAPDRAPSAGRCAPAGDSVAGDSEGGDSGGDCEGGDCGANAMAHNTSRDSQRTGAFEPHPPPPAHQQPGPRPSPQATIYSNTCTLTRPCDRNTHQRNVSVHNLRDRTSRGSLTQSKCPPACFEQQRPDAPTDRGFGTGRLGPTQADGARLSTPRAATSSPQGRAQTGLTPNQDCRLRA